MTKRHLKTDLDELGDEVLKDLGPTDRVALKLRAEANGRDGWTDRLQRTCPKHTYETYEPEFTKRMRLATAWGADARYDLRLYLERYRFATLLRQRDILLSVVAAQEMESLVASITEETDETAAPIDWIADLARHYYGYEKFAEEVLGISLAEWVDGIPGDDGVVESAAEVLAMYESLNETNAADEANPEEVLEVSDGAEKLYEMLKEKWQNIDEPRFVTG